MTTKTRPRKLCDCERAAKRNGYSVERDRVLQIVKGPNNTFVMVCSKCGCKLKTL